MLINRWYHQPKLHIPDPHEEKKPSWLELFYDLVYVAAIIQLGNGLSENAGLFGFLVFGVLFFILWYTWANFSFFYNRFNVDDALQRTLVFTQMFAIGGMAVSVNKIFEGDHVQFIACLAIARLLTAAMYFRAWKTGGVGGALGQVYATHGLVSAVLWLGSLVLPGPWFYGAWLVAILVDVYAPLSQRVRDVESQYPTDGGHIVERFGLLTIIVLGEMFVKVLTEISERADGGTPEMLATASMGLLVTCSLWWLYFDDVAGSRVKRQPWAHYVWIWVHCPMMLGITAVGVAIKKAVFFDPGYVAPAKYRYLLCGVLALTLFSMAIIDWVTERHHAEMRDSSRVKARFGGGILVLLMGAAGGYMTALYFLVLVAICCVVQVLFDLAMAPERPEHAEHAGLFNYVETSPETEPDPEEAQTERRRRNLETLNTVRLGVPDSLRQDLYFRLMQGSWLQLFGIVAVTYFLQNVFFAALFILEPASIGGVGDPNFFDAFSFSIQTFTTVGFGGLTPATPYGDTLVAIEAFFGIVWVALVTGLVYAKASRPEASVLFSKWAVITPYHGQPTLMFRLGNARGNSVVEATIKVTIIKDETSPEGIRMRRLYDLDLHRSRQPIFALAWTVFHTLDENSPLYGIDAENLNEMLVTMIVTVVGHDETYASTVQTRHMYLATDLRYGETFVDVMSIEDDGQLVLDYRKFHDTVPDQTALSAETPTPEEGAADSRSEDSAPAPPDGDEAP